MMRRLALQPFLAASQCVMSMAGAPSAVVMRRPVSTEPNPSSRRLLFKHDSFLCGTSAIYIENMYQEWKRDSSSVDASWDKIFSSPSIQDFEKPLLENPIYVLPPESTDFEVKQSLQDCDRLTWMIQAFEDRGHLVAQTDPLDYQNMDATLRTPLRKYREVVRFDLSYFGFSEQDAERVVRVGFQDNVGGLLNTISQPMTIRSLHNLLLHRYCSRVGFELTHIPFQDGKRFIRSQIELERADSVLHRTLSKAEKIFVWEQIASAVFFEDFFKRKYSTQKRFGCDGAESLIVGLRALIESSAGFGVKKINLGMAHRGRLNVLYHIIGKPFEVILKEFVGVTGPELAPYKIQSDVKYHLGCRAALKLLNGSVMETELLCNPSHLEAVNPFVQGYTRADQFGRGGRGRTEVLPIEIHGDAAFAGQGVAFESMGICESGEYDTGGTIHIVCNNQIGFTTDPAFSRSTAYCTDLGHVYGCPILHVNGDSPEDVYHIFEFAAEYRARFKRSVVIDLVCYRRFGHNENDDPSITQPLMYERINSIPNVFRRYSDQLIAEGVISTEDASSKALSEKERYGSFVEAVQRVNYAQYLRESIPLNWKAMKYSDELGQVTHRETTVPKETIRDILQALKTYPAGFELHAELKTFLDQRNQSIEKGQDIDWGTAETLAFGSLVHEGHNVRVMGVDVECGACLQRHAVLHDQKSEKTYVPLAHISENQGKFLATNSPFNEYGTLGYAAGYALHDPNTLVMWEAQYGDLADGATIVFDQFLSAGESKWNQQQACIVALPHGYSDKNAEFFTGRLERFLQMSSEDVTTPPYSKEERAHRVNWEVTYPTTPAQYFHLLRRHLKRDYRNALIVFFSRQSLDAPNVSTLDEILNGSFQSLIGDPAVPPSAASRLVFCTGQVYHILNAYRQKNGIEKIALVRLEELSPFPVAEVQQLLKEYDDAELVWAQEEPRNMGAWSHVEPRIDEYTKGKRALRYVGPDTRVDLTISGKNTRELEYEKICKAVFY